MVTPESIKSKLQGLINKCADTTGVVDTNLTSAVNRVINGYGEGGGPDISKDATATADDIVAPKTAVVNGELIEGNIKTAHGGVSKYVTPEKAGGMPFVKMSHTIDEPTYISPNTGGEIQMYAPFEDFGNAEKEHVTAGMTFTSVAGFQEVGTAKNSYDEGKADGYAEGKIDGYAEGETAGIEQGKKAQYDEFWDKYQENGNRYNYNYGAFAGVGWNDETFKPKYPIKPKYCFGMFTGCLITEIKDIDFSVAADIKQVFYVCALLEKVGIVNAPLAGSAQQLFNGDTKLHTIEKLVVGEQCTFNNDFNNCTALENLIIEGTIGQNGLNLQWSTKLSKASIESIITHLSSTTSGLSVTLSKTSVDTAFETSEGAADGSTGEEWLALIAPKSNWTIQLL